MCAALDNFALVQDQDEIGIHHGLNAMGNDKGAAALHQMVERLADFAFGFGVDRGGGIVKDKDARVPQQSSGYRHPLFLAAGQGHALFSHHRFVAFREGEDDIMDGSSAGCSIHFFVRYFTRDAVGDVVAQGAGEEEGFLFDNADLAAQVPALIILQFFAIQSDVTSGVVIKTREAG